MLYHEWLLEQHRKERLMQETLDLPPTDTDLGLITAHTQCAQCSEIVHRDDVVVKTVHTGRSSQTKHFCTDNCHHTWYLTRLRSWGM